MDEFDELLDKLFSFAREGLREELRDGRRDAGSGVGVLDTEDSIENECRLGVVAALDELSLESVNWDDLRSNEFAPMPTGSSRGPFFLGVGSGSRVSGQLEVEVFRAIGRFANAFDSVNEEDGGSGEGFM